MDLHGSALSLLTVVVLVSFANAGYHGGCSKYCPYGQRLDFVNCLCVGTTIFRDSYSLCPSTQCSAGRFPCRRYKRDANGCNTCQCLDRCYRSVCPSQCQWGTEQYVDDYGCSSCRCKLYTTCNSGFNCHNQCSHGYIQDHAGCNTCQCKSAPCGFGGGCSLSCPYGRMINSAGCELCECKPKLLCGPVCDNSCNSGRVLDLYGCPTCQCLGG